MTKYSLLWLLMTKRLELTTREHWRNVGRHKRMLAIRWGAIATELIHFSYHRGQTEQLRTMQRAIMRCTRQIRDCVVETDHHLHVISRRDYGAQPSMMATRAVWQRCDAKRAQAAHLLHSTASPIYQILASVSELEATIQ